MRLGASQERAGVRGKGMRLGASQERAGVMVLSDEKISHLSHLILNYLKAPGRARLKVDEPVALREIKRLLAGELKAEDEADVAVRRRLASYSKPLPEGTTEWETLYRKAFQEEMRKRNKV